MKQAFPAVANFDELIRTREARVGIVGLGYAGLPLAIAFADAGFAVTGIDVNVERVGAVNRAEQYLVDVPAERYLATDGRLKATADYSAVADLDALTICVPTPLSKTRTPDLSYILSAVDSLTKNIREGQLVILQSTSYPGTTAEILVPAVAEAGFTVGENVFIGYAPERVDPGNPVFNIANTPKLVAGVTPECTRRTSLLYSQIVDQVVEVSNPTVAEMAKLHENTFRAVNIALANELALMCDRVGISPWEVIDAAATKPFGFLPHYPGPGLGGDCIPVVPQFLAWRLREYGYSAQLIEAAQEINAHMPVYVLQKIVDALNDHGKPLRGARILLLGMAYKPDVNDTRESPSIEVYRRLADRGSDVVFSDPWVSTVALDDDVISRVPFSAEEFEKADCVVVLTAHSAFVDEPLWKHARLIVDTRNAVPPGANVYRI